MPLPPDFEKRLWNAADQLWTNSTLKPSQYSTPVLALIFLKYADHRFAEAEKELARGRRRGTVGKEDYHALGVLYVPEPARFSRLLNLPEGADIGKELNNAMKAIEADNDEVKGVLPRTYGSFETTMLKELLKLFNTVPGDVEGDVFGRIYEYFLGNFAPRSCASSSRFSSHTTAPSTTPPAGPAACSSRARTSSPSTRRLLPTRSASTASRKLPRPTGWRR